MSDLFIFGFSSTSAPKTDLSSATITLGPSLTYNGSEQTQTVASVVVDGVTLTLGLDYIITDNTATNAGNYTLSIVGIGNYSGAATQVWSIAKAAGSVSLNPTSLSLDTSNLTGVISVTRIGDGVITAESSDTSVATVSVSGTNITVEAVGNGNATITVNVGAGTNHLAASTTASVDVTLISNILADNSPATIHEVAQAGTGEQYWSIGDRTAPMAISEFYNMPSVSSVCAYILGFNHNSSYEGTGIHFQFGITTDGTYVAFGDTGYASFKTTGSWFNMKSSASNVGGWKSSPMRTKICPAFKSAMPTDWQNVIKACTKYTGNSTAANSTVSAAVTSTSDDIFLLATYEVFGTSSYTNTYEKSKQAQYAFYANGNTKIKNHYSNQTSSCIQWLRSPKTTSSMFMRILGSGALSYRSAYYAQGIAPAFVVG